MNLIRRFSAYVFLAIAALATNGDELIVEVADGVWSDTTVWRAITYSPTTKTEVDYFPNSTSTTVSIEKNITLDGNYKAASIMTGYSSRTNYLYTSSDSNVLTTDSSFRHFVLRGGDSNSNDLHIMCNVFATYSNSVGGGTAGFVYGDNAKDTTAPKYLTLYKNFSTTEPIKVDGIGASKSYLTILGNVESINNGVYGKFNISKANVRIDGNIDVANLVSSSDSALTLNGKLFTHGISGQNMDGVKIQGACTIGENAGIRIAGSYGNMYLSYGADVQVNSAEGSLIVPRHLRMDGNSILTFNTSGALITKEGGNPIDAPLWFWGGTQKVVLNADNAFSGFCFGSSTQLTVELGDNCKKLELNSLSVKLDTNDGYLTSTNSLTFKNFRNNVVKVNSVRDETELKRIFADGYKSGSFFISAEGYLNAFKSGNVVISGFLDTTTVPTANSSTAVRNQDGSLTLNSAGRTTWVAGIKTKNLKSNTQYTIKLNYTQDTSIGGFAQIYVRNQYVSNVNSDYGSSTLRSESGSVYLSISTDDNGQYYKICIDTFGATIINITDFEVYEEEPIKFAAADAAEKYTGEISNLPTGANEFDVQLPAETTRIITPQMCTEIFGLSEASTNSAYIINSIINYAKNNGYKKIVLPHGRYYDNTTTRINFQYLTDFTFDGNGSTIVFDKNLKTSGSGNFYMGSNNRFKFCNLNIDWNWQDNPLASIVEVVGVNKSGTQYVDFKFTEYDYFPVRENVRVATLSRYDPETESVGVEGGYTKSYEMYVGKSIPTVEWLSDNVLRVYVDASSYQIGHLLRMQHSYYEMGNINMQSNTNITLENVNIYSCSGHALLIGGVQKYTHMKNVNIVRPPNTPKRAITCTADHLHVSSSKGYIKIEDCEFSRGADDCINFHDCTVFMYKYSDTSLKTINNRNTNLYTIGQTLEFRHGDYSPANFTATVVAQNVIDADNGIVEVVFDKTLPEVYQKGFILFNHTYDTRNIIVRNSYFHDNRARGILILASDVTLDNCRFFHNEMGAVKFETGYTMTLWCEGHGVNNVVVRNCTFDTVNPGGSTSKDGFERDIYFGVYLSQDPSSDQTYYPILKNILFENNTFYNTYGLAAWIASTGNLIIRDNTFINERPRNSPKSYRGAFRVTYSSDTKIINNTYIESANPLSAGVYYSPTTTANILIAGNMTVAKPDISFNAQPQNISLRLKPDETPSGVLSASADSYYEKSYQWYMSTDSGETKNFAPLDSQVAQTLDVSQLGLAQTAYFYCKASDSESSANSDIATVALERYINQIGDTSKAIFKNEYLAWNFDADYIVGQWIFSGDTVSGLSFDSVNGTLYGIPQSAGVYTFGIEALTSDGASSGVINYTLNVSENTQQYSSWLSSNFTEAEIANPEISGDMASPAGDGISNLQKYAMGLSPKTYINSVSVEPIIAKDTNYEFSLDFIKAVGVEDSDVQFVLQHSYNMTDWSDCSEAEYSVVETSVATNKIRVGIKNGNGANTDKKFYRLDIRRVK